MQATPLLDSRPWRLWVVPHTHWDREWYLPLGENLVFSAVKAAEDGDGTILRVFNAGSADTELGLPQAERCRLDEAPLEGGEEIRAGEIASFRLRVRRLNT